MERLIWTLIIALLFLGCSDSGDDSSSSDDTSRGAIALANLNGTWRTLCAGPDDNGLSTQRTDTYADGSITSTIRIYRDDNTCNKTSALFIYSVATATLSLNGVLRTDANGLEVQGIDIKIVSILGYATENSVAIFNTILKPCGLSNWVANEAKEVTGLTCLDNVYPAKNDILLALVKVDGKTLYLTEGDTKIRPEALDSDDVYTYVEK